LNASDLSFLNVEISDTQSHLSIDREWLVSLVCRTLLLEGLCRASISVAVMNDASIRVINARYLSHDWATDVISFRFSEDHDPELMGELVISAEMAVNNAQEIGSDPLQEVALYLVHGLLHLCGYDDQTAEDVVVIREREAVVLASIGLENSLRWVGSLPVRSDDSGRESVRWPR